MSFLNQLKSQASELQNRDSAQNANLEQNTRQVEMACKSTLLYFNDLARQLNVLMPAGPKFSIDGKTPWPAMKLTDFRVDSRKKMLRDKEVFGVISMGWSVLPQMGKPVGGTVSVNFPPDLQRVESRLAVGKVKHERKDIRHPEKNTLQAFRFDYITESQGTVTVTPDHDTGNLAFRLANVTGFELHNTTWPGSKIQTDVLDELAKLIVAQPSRFLP